MNNNVPIEDLAMIKLKYKFDPQSTIHICTDSEVESSDILGSCGMGAVSTKQSRRTFPGTASFLSFWFHNTERFRVTIENRVRLL